MTVRQQRNILEHTYRLLTGFNHRISPGVRYATFRITPYPDNVKCHREVFLPGGKRVNKVPNLCWKTVSSMVSMELLITHIPYEYSQEWELDSEDHFRHGTRVGSTCRHVIILREKLCSCHAYYMRDADSWHKIDYTSRAET